VLREELRQHYRCLAYKPKVWLLRGSEVDTGGCIGPSKESAYFRGATANDPSKGLGDRRGHGRSGQSWHGNNMNQYADDLAELMNHLDLKEATMVGHSTGGGEVVRYIARHGQKRVAKAVLIAAVPPLMLQTEKNLGGLPLAVFDEIRAGVVNDRSQFFKDLTLPFYGYNRPAAKVSDGVRDSFWLQGMKVSIVGAYDCIKAFSETDQTEDLKYIEVPTLVIHGDDDQSGTPCIPWTIANRNDRILEKQCIGA